MVEPTSLQTYVIRATFSGMFPISEPHSIKIQEGMFGSWAMRYSKFQGQSMLENTLEKYSQLQL
jgi:hypothetical protein